MAQSSRSIVTVEQAKEYCGIQRGDTSKDSALEFWIDLVSGQFEEETRNKVKPQAVEEILDGTGTDYLETHFFPVLDVWGKTSEADGRLDHVQYRDTYNGTWTNLLSAVDEFYVESIDAMGLTILSGDVFPIGNKNIKVKYWAGYNDPPADIVKVILEAVAMMYKESGQGSGALGVSSQSFTSPTGSSSSSYRDFGPTWQKVVNSHRKYL